MTWGDLRGARLGRGDGWVYLWFLTMLGLTQACEAWLCEACPHPGDCVCRCHGSRWKDWRL